MMPVENAKSRKNLRSGNNGREGGSKLSHSLSRANAAAGWSGSTTVGQTNFSSININKPLSRDEQHIVREAEDEFRRRGHFKRIFPTMEYHYYKQFFLQGERPLNKLLDDRIMEKRRMRA